MSGIGIFFTLVIVLAGIYFVGGAFYNFKMYNARGLDLIPHRGECKLIFWEYDDDFLTLLFFLIRTTRLLVGSPLFN